MKNFIVCAINGVPFFNDFMETLATRLQKVNQEFQPKLIIIMAGMQPISNEEEFEKIARSKKTETIIAGDCEGCLGITHSVLTDEVRNASYTPSYIKKLKGNDFFIINFCPAFIKCMNDVLETTRSKEFERMIDSVVHRLTYGEDQVIKGLISPPTSKN